MINCIVNFEVAKLAKELGYDVPCLYTYGEDGSLIEFSDMWNVGCEGGMELEDFIYDHNKEKDRYSAPFYESFRIWLMVSYKIHVFVSIDVNTINNYTSYNALAIIDGEKICLGNYNSYRAGMNAASHYALTMIKTKKAKEMDLSLELCSECKKYFPKKYLNCTSNPYKLELYNDTSLVYMCENCYKGICDEI